MKLDLAAELDLNPRELVAFTGGGGKTTLMTTLAEQLAGRGDRVITTTTTKLGLDQTEGRVVCWSDDPGEVDAALARNAWVMVLSDADDHKVVGYPPEAVDSWFAATRADYVLVEADGARRRPLKAPSSHEPVIPSHATLVVIVTGVDAVGRTIEEAAHRPQQATELSGLSSTAEITPDVVARIVSHERGGLQGVPHESRVVVAVTKVSDATREAAEAVQRELNTVPRIGRVLLIPFVKSG